MEYLRPLSLITSGRDWWVAPLAFAAINLVFAVLGIIPIIGILASLVSLVFVVYLYGWLAECQRAALADQAGLPTPMNGDYFLDGLRAVLVTFVWSLPLLLVVMIGVGGSVLVSNVDRDLGAILLLVAMGFGVLVALAWLPLPYLAMTRTNLSRDWAGFEMGAVFQTFQRAIVESYLGMIVWAVVGIGLTLLGFLACIVGVYFAQPVMLAGTSMFWVDVYKVAVERGAPHVRGDMAPIGSYARTFE